MQKTCLFDDLSVRRPLSTLNILCTFCTIYLYLFCPGINGFGSTMVRIELYVTDTLEKGRIPRLNHHLNIYFFHRVLDTICIIHLYITALRYNALSFFRLKDANYFFFVKIDVFAKKKGSIFMSCLKVSSYFTIMGDPRYVPCTR